MEKKNDPKRTFRKNTVEMTGEAEVLVVNTRLYARTIQAAMALGVLCTDENCGQLTKVDRMDKFDILSHFIGDLLLELGDGVNLHILPTDLDQNCDDEIIL